MPTGPRAPASRTGWVVALLVGLLLAPLAFAATLPAVTGRVVDEAGIIAAAAEAALDRRLAAFEQ